MIRSLLLLFCFCSMAALGQSTNALSEKLQGRMGCGIVSADTTKQPRIVLRCGLSRPAIKPLIVLDGELLENDSLSSINPNTIESISILKEVKAAALYGCRASNGVILITTKKVKDCRLVVLDEQDSLPIAGASISIKSSWAIISMASQQNGEAIISTRLQSRPYNLTVTNIGYMPAEKQIRFDSSKQKQIVYLKRAYKKLDSVMVASYGAGWRRCGGCGMRVTWIRNHTHAEKSANENNFSVWPNPVAVGQRLTVSIPQTFTGFYQLFSSNGQVLQVAKTNTQKAQSFQIATGNWPCGVYFIKLMDETTGKSFTQKFILQ